MIGAVKEMLLGMVFILFIIFTPPFLIALWVVLLPIVLISYLWEKYNERENV